MHGKLWRKNKNRNHPNGQLALVLQELLPVHASCKQPLLTYCNAHLLSLSRLFTRRCLRVSKFSSTFAQSNACSLTLFGEGIKAADLTLTPYVFLSLTSHGLFLYTNFFTSIRNKCLRESGNLYSPIHQGHAIYVTEINC
jgi:hypothetical protein